MEITTAIGKGINDCRKKTISPSRIPNPPGDMRTMTPPIQEIDNAPAKKGTCRIGKGYIETTK
jgi:hypothetical protein